MCPEVNYIQASSIMFFTMQVNLMTNDAVITHVIAGQVIGWTTSRSVLWTVDCVITLLLSFVMDWPGPQ